MTVSPTSKTLIIGQTLQLSKTVKPSNTTEGTSWTSSNTAVATVSNTGLVTAKGVGTATITLKASESNKSASCTVTVTAGNIFVGGGSILAKYDNSGNQLWYKWLTYKSGVTDQRLEINQLVIK